MPPSEKIVDHQKGKKGRPEEEKFRRQIDLAFFLSPKDHFLSFKVGRIFSFPPLILSFRAREFCRKFGSSFVPESAEKAQSGKYRPFHHLSKLLRKHDLRREIGTALRFPFRSATFFREKTFSRISFLLSEAQGTN